MTENNQDIEAQSAEDVTIWKKARFSSATAAYRIFRLSLELFLVEHIIATGHRVSTAGVIFLFYSIADVLFGLLFLWFPTICFGSTTRAIVFFWTGVGCTTTGFIGLFVSETFLLMAFFASLCGCGTAVWFVNYQTLTNICFVKLDQIARIRQFFECIGFLLPSICLATVNSVGSNSGSIARYSSILLGIIGLGLYLVSADVVIRSASHLDRDRITHEQGHVFDSVRRFFKSSIFMYFLLDSILLAASNILFATMSVITEHYFGLEPTLLWLAAIGVPIGGAVSVASSLKVGSSLDNKTRVISGGTLLVLLFSIMICVSPLIESGPAHQETAAKAGLFFFGLVVGFLYSDAFSSAFALWLEKLKDFDPGFLSRANVFHNVGVQAIIASTFQVQTILIDVSLRKGASLTVQSLVFYGPLILLIGSATMVVSRLPYPKDKKFAWPLGPVYSRLTTFIFRWFGKMLLGNRVGMFTFGIFSDWRTSFFSVNLNNSTPQGGSTVEPAHRPVPADFEAHLLEFDKLNTKEEWRTSNCTLRNMLLSNEVAFEKRFELINKARSTIWLVTWALDGFIGNQLADELIQRHEDGIDVRVMVDAVNLRYLEEKRSILNEPYSTSISILQRLVGAGIEVKILGTLHNIKGKPYVIGSHRKILLVDNRFMLTGGRNSDDSYAGFEETEGYHYHDAEVLFEGHFDESTAKTMESLWEKAMNADKILMERPCDGEQAKRDQNSDTDNTHDELTRCENGSNPELGMEPSDHIDEIGKTNHGQDLSVMPRKDFMIDSVAHRRDHNEGLSISMEDYMVDGPQHQVEGGNNAKSDHDDESNATQNVIDLELGGTETKVRIDPSDRTADHDEHLSIGLEDDMIECSLADDDDDANVDTKRDDTNNPSPTRPSFFRTVSQQSSQELGHELVVFELDHKAGRVDGHDITLSSLVFLIETAQKSIDLVFGYFQLFDVLHKAMEHAISRGVHVRLFTNSQETNDLTFFNPIFQEAMRRLLDLGVEIYVPSLSHTKNEGEYCLHYKLALIDSNVLLTGSWNAIGTSVFYDAEFSIVMFDNDEKANASTAGAFHAAQDFVRDSIQHGRFVQLDKCPEPWKPPMSYKMLMSSNGRRQLKRGF